MTSRTEGCLTASPWRAARRGQFGQNEKRGLPRGLISDLRAEKGARGREGEQEGRDEEKQKRRGGRVHC